MQEELKHLEFIQNAINRFANNSFLLKGWTITLVGVFIAFASKDASHKIMLLSFFPAVVFWFLDAYYLWHERLFRRLFEDVAAKKVKKRLSMDVTPYKDEKTYRAAFFSHRLILFYGIVIAVILAAALIVRGNHGS
jgi:hypothetical protein